MSPQSFINLIVKLRIPPRSAAKKEPYVQSEDDEKREQRFLVSKKDAEDVSLDNTGKAFAHAPHWPQTKKPSWWVVLGDIKANKIVVPPFKVTDIPFTDSDYRMYKMQFQAPQNVGSYTWRVFVVSDTYVGDDTYQDITVSPPPFEVSQYELTTWMPISSWWSKIYQSRVSVLREMMMISPNQMKIRWPARWQLCEVVLLRRGKLGATMTMTATRMGMRMVMPVVTAIATNYFSICRMLSPLPRTLPRCIPVL